MRKCTFYKVKIYKYNEKESFLFYFGAVFGCQFLDNHGCQKIFDSIFINWTVNRVDKDYFNFYTSATRIEHDFHFLHFWLLWHIRFMFNSCTTLKRSIFILGRSIKNN